MKIKELIKKIEKDYPVSSSLSFDNTGSNIVDFEAEITGILVCLDITLDAISYAKENNINFIISHHPIIFNPIKNINDDMLSRRIKLLLKYGISAYSMHTNFDTDIKKGMGKLFIDTVFGKTNILKHNYLELYDKTHAIGDILYFKKPMSFEKIRDSIFKKLNVKSERCAYYKNNNNVVKKIIILPGAGSSETDLAIKEGCDIYITSDLKHNNLIDLKDAGISYINPTHHYMENIFVNYITKYLKRFL